MRVFVLFALALFGTATFSSSDASAFGKRKKGSDCSSCCTPPAPPCQPTCSSSCQDGCQPGHHHHHASLTIDGRTYVLGEDGTYYASSDVTTLGGFTTQPYYRTAMPGPYAGTYSTYPGTYTYPGMYRGTGYPTGVYPAGYTSGYYNSGVTPAGYTAPLTMPGINIGAGGITVTPMVAPRR